MFVVTNLCRLAFTSRFSLMRAGAMVSLTLATALVTPLPPHLVLSPSLSIAVSFLVLGGPCRHRACSPELTGLVGAGRGTRGDNGAVEASLGDLQTVSIMCHVDHEMNRKLTMSTSTCLCVLASCTPCIRKAKSTARQNLRWGYRESRRQSGRGSGTRVRIKLVSRVYIYSLSIVRECQCHSQQRCKLGRIIGSDLRRSRQRELTFWMAIFADIYKWGGKRVSGCLFLLYIYIYVLPISEAGACRGCPSRALVGRIRRGSRSEPRIVPQLAFVGPWIVSHAPWGCLWRRLLTSVCGWMWMRGIDAVVVEDAVWSTEDNLRKLQVSCWAPHLP